MVLSTYTPILCVYLGVAQTLRDFKNSTILVHMSLNAKGAQTGCGRHGYKTGYSSVSVLLLTGQSDIS